MQSYYLSDLCNVSSGGTPPRNDSQNYQGGIPWVKISDIENSDGWLSSTDETISNKGLAAMRGKIFPKGTLLFAMYGSVGKMAFTEIPVTTNQAILGINIIQKNLLLNKYLYYWLLKEKNNLLSRAKGVAQKNLSANFIRKLKINLPSIVRQKRIADILDKADAIRKKRQKMIEELDSLLRAVFLDMFGDPVVNSRKWNLVPIKAGISRIESGWSANSSNISAGRDQFGVLKISSVTSGVFISEENKLVSSFPTNKKLIHPLKGDLLFSRANTRELVAATCIVDASYHNLFLPDKLWRIETNDLIKNEFLKMLLTEAKYREGLCAKASGTSGSMLNISKQKFLNHLMPLPPVSIQKKFSRVFWKVYDLKASLAFNAHSENKLFNSLMHDAFNGDL